MNEKKKIYYTRTYRHLKKNHLKSGLYLLIFILPCLIIFSMNLHNLTKFLSDTGVAVLGRAFPGIPMYISRDVFSFLGTIEYIDMPTTYPGLPFVFANLVIMLLALVFLGTGRRKGKPVAIFCMLMVIIHIVNCVYFIFAANHFPYLADQFSNLYMKQQIGIWLTFIVLSGLVTGFLGNRGYLYKILTFLATMAYSLVFGVVRYILFLYLLQQFSILYMALMYFVFGPLFDFLYFVGIYSIFANKMVKMYDTGEGREDWEWL